MKTFKQWFCFCLSLILLLSLLPTSVFTQTVQAAEEIFAEEDTAASKAPTRDPVSASSVSVPSYSGGDATSWMTYDCGFSSNHGDIGTDSKMRVINNTTPAQYKAYCTKLESNGYTKIFSNTMADDNGDNLFAKFLANDGTHLLYVYYLAVYTQVRMMVDTNPMTFRNYSYTPTGSYRTELYMYGLSGAEDGFSTGEEELNTQYRSNAGSMLFFRMSDNSLFIIDGGGSNQMGDRSCEDLYNFLRRITGVPEGEKMVINTWFTSHYDGDHVGGFARFLHKFHLHFDVKNIMYNYDGQGSSHGYFRRVSRLFPNMQFYKPHTGDSFTVSGVKFDVLYTVEDRYKPNSNYDLILESSDCTNYPDGNDTSVVLRASFDGKTALLTGDLNQADKVLMKVHPASALKADLLQIPHHGFDNHTTLVKTVAPTISFLNQVESAVRNCEGIYRNNDGWAPYAGTIYYGGTNIVGYAADEGVFLKETFQSVSNLDWSTKSYLFWEANPYSQPPVKANEQYYGYTKVDEVGQDDQAYLIVDPKVNRVLSYNVANRTANSADNGLFDGEKWYFSASSRQNVNWIIHRNLSQYNPDSALPDAVTTYSDGVPIRKGTGDYWSTSGNSKEVVLGNNDSFSYSGMFDSFASFPNQIESAAKWTWMDVLKDGSFLIYRHASGTYYPLFRDGNVVSSGGWGTAALSGSTVRNYIDYIKTHLYVYNETPADMYVSWTGHKDYYCYAGLRKEDMISLLAADIRVKWSIPDFGASGESLHTTRNEKHPGEYWFEFSPTFSNAALGDIKATIIYKNANGKLMEAGSVTIHVVDRDPEDYTPYSLEFGFGDETADRYRYKNAGPYGEINYDGTLRWRFKEYIPSPKSTVDTPGEVNTDNGVLTLRKTKATDHPNTLYAETFALSGTPLSLNPKYAEVVQIRLKMENMKAVEGYNPFFRLWYFNQDGNRVFDNLYNFGTNYVSDGEYVTITLDLYTQDYINANAATQTLPEKPMTAFSKVTGIRLGFHEFTLADSSKEGVVTIDHVYVGPRAGLPQEEPKNLLFHFDNAEDARNRYTNEIYNGHNFDREEQPNWATLNTDRAYTISNSDSTLTLPVGQEALNGVYGPWLTTATFHNVFPGEGERFRQPLGYAPDRAEVVQIRFKTEDCILADNGLQPGVVVTYDRDTAGQVGRGTYEMEASYTLQNGKYTTVTLPLSEDFRNADFITSLGFQFRNIKGSDAGKGHVTIDYIFVGAEEDAPMEMADVTFVNADGTVLYYARIPAGTAVAYEGKTPEKTPTSTEHFTFNGWVDDKGQTPDFAEVNEDLILTATYQATPHSFTYREVDKSHHEKFCPCGYSETHDHNWDEGTLVSHPCTQDGLVRYNCAVCGAIREDITPMAGHKTVVTPGKEATCTADGVTEGEICTVCGTVLKEATVIPATGHAMITVTGKEATCTASGMTDYVYCATCEVVFQEQQILPRLGHSYSYKDNGNGTHTGTCIRCTKTTTGTHTVTESGSCLCGFKSLVTDQALTLKHSLNLASDISVNLIVSRSLLAGFDMDTVYVESTVDTATGTTTQRIYPVENGSYYYFTMDGLTAIQMNDKITSVLYGTKNGQTYCSPVDEYSIATYAYSQLDKTAGGSRLHTLCADLLRYGAKAQIYKGYRTDLLADSAMTEAHRAYLSDIEAVTFGNTDTVLNDLPNAPITWKGKALNLESKVALKLAFNTAGYKEDPTELTLRISYKDAYGNTKAMVLEDPELYIASSGVYAFTLNTLLAAELRAVISAQIYAGDVPVSPTLQYSPDTYGNHKTGALLELCKALFAYSDSAKAFFAK